MKKQKNVVIFAVVFLIVFFAFNNNVYADNEWLKTGATVSCGNISNIPYKFPEIVSSLINVVQVVVPILLVIFGIIDLTKGIMSQDDNEAKKGRQTFVKRLIAGASVFLIIILVKFLVNAAAGNNSNSIISCMNCFISGECTITIGTGEVMEV